MGFELGFSICKKGEGCVMDREVACLRFWCSAGRGISRFLDECVDSSNYRNDGSEIVLTMRDVEFIRAKLNSAYSGSDVIGEARMQYILEDMQDTEFYMDDIIARAKEVNADINTVLMAVKNYSWVSEMTYGTFLQFREMINSIAEMELQDEYELVCWMSA